MANNQEIVEKLSLFNNRTFTRKQWGIILQGCGCPKSTHIWTALRENNLHKFNRAYTLVDLNEETYEIVYSRYLELNRAACKKNYMKKKARKKADSFKGITLYMIEGCLTDTIPTRE